MAIFDKTGNKKIEKARKVLNEGGYVITKNDGTVIYPETEKKPLPKKKIAVIAGVGAAGLAGIGLGIKHLLGGSVVSTETVEAVADVVADVAAEVEADEAVEALETVVEDAIDTSMVL